MLRRHELMAAAGAAGAGGWNPGLLTDPDVAAWYRFLFGALVDDATDNGNDLTNINGVTECTSLGENLGCVNFDFVSSQYLMRAASDLSANFPFKQGSSNNQISVCFWVKRTAGHGYDAIYTLTDDGGVGYFAVYYYGAKIRLGLDSGDQVNYYTHGTNTVPGTLYFVVVSYDADTRNYRIHVYDCDADEILGTDLTGTSNITMTTSLAFNELIGERTDDYLDGRIGGGVVARKIFTPPEFNQIREGTYGT